MSATLEARDIVKTFTVRRDGGVRTINALNHVSLGVASGEIVGLVGESGSGKTTIARIPYRHRAADQRRSHLWGPARPHP